MAGHQASIWTGIAIPWFAALISLGMRISARRVTKVTWWFDDYFALLAFGFATGYCAVMIEWTLHAYLGVLIPDSMPTDEHEAILERSRFLSYFNSLCYAASIACSKIAILCLYWRLFKVSSIRIPILVLLVVVIIWIFIRTFMLTFRCLPVQSLWDYTIQDKVCHIDSDKFFLGTITTHFILDVIILVLPIFEVFQLRMRIGQKFGVAGLFLIGTIVCVASAVVLAILVNFPTDAQQVPYNYAMFCVWGSVEVNIAVVSACFPLLRPIFSLVFPRGIFSSYGDTKSYPHLSGRGFPISGHSHPASRSRTSTKHTTIVRSKQKKDSDDSSSTYQLADLRHDARSIESTSKNNQGDIQTVITSAEPGYQDRGGPSEGIMVLNTVEVEYNSRA